MASYETSLEEIYVLILSRDYRKIRQLLCEAVVGEMRVHSAHVDWDIISTAKSQTVTPCAHKSIKDTSRCDKAKGFRLARQMKMDRVENEREVSPRVQD